ncbi:S9 family peptidase [Entomobacter blattae]|uniref:Dipeptidyl aminopeptidase BI n=1 Tax=Entomobacter blattae TaxID=2762277 RepID=A0A7H1NSU2_9PROT|nr:S9 family peptidase [Entomobacter blattae]QNT78852.1 Dipeptidyl aminopeptidase BI [Entomobacter blattae]
MSYPSAPRTPKKDHTIEQLGHIRHDHYAWLKDENWQNILVNPALLQDEIAQHLKEENAYTEAVLADTRPLQETLFEEMKVRLPPKDNFPPYPDGPWEYYRRFPEEGQYILYARKPRTAAKHVGENSSDKSDEDETILLDVNAIAREENYCHISHATHSPDHLCFAYALDTQGSENYQIFVKDITTQTILSPTIENCSGAFTFGADSRYLFWVYRNKNGRSTRVYRRDIALGTDDLVYEEEDSGFFLTLSKTSSGQWIIISTHDHDTSETWLIPTRHPLNIPFCVEPRAKGLQYDVQDWGGRLIIRTNCDEAVDFKLMEAPITTPSRPFWKNFYSHKEGRYLIDFKVFSHYLVCLEREEAQTRITILDKKGNSHRVGKGNDLGTYSFDGSLEYDTDELRYGYQSPSVPRQWYSYKMSTRTQILLKEQTIPSGHTPSDYITVRLFAYAADGERIPITLTRHKDTPQDGSAPLLLYGYGSYGYAIDPVFSPSTLSLLQRGWCYAIAHVRGGSEKGWRWFENGRLMKKKNTFTDFISCAEYLIAEQYTAKKRIVADGRSAGGMLMGAITNLRPDLFGGIIAVVPFVDVLNTMSDASLPLTPPEWPEWGNPLTDPLAYEYIASYSPYDNITSKDYPPILAMGGLTDPRVTYWEPAKWVAKLREYSTSPHPVLLKINMEAGHGGSSGRYKTLQETALLYAFAQWAVSSFHTDS